MSELRYQNLTVDWAPACRELELSIFTHANPDELLSQSDFEAYARVFPEGFFLGVDGDRLAGQAGGICLDFDFDRPQHGIVEITGENQCGNHNPEGDWYYGTDIAVRPEYRRRGIGRQFYERRKNLVIEQGKKGVMMDGDRVTFQRLRYISKIQIQLLTLGTRSNFKVFFLTRVGSCSYRR